jgi:hypothetical protein
MFKNIKLKKYKVILFFLSPEYLVNYIFLLNIFLKHPIKSVLLTREYHRNFSGMDCKLFIVQSDIFFLKIG